MSLSPKTKILPIPSPFSISKLNHNPKKLNLTPPNRDHFYQSATMCIVIEKRHIQCKHFAGFVIGTPCPNACDTGTKCLPYQCDLIKGWFVSPPRCETCYLEVQRQIRAEAERGRVVMTQYVDETKRKLENQDLDDVEQAYYFNMLYQTSERLKMTRRKCAQNLKTLKESQMQHWR